MPKCNVALTQIIQYFLQDSSSSSSSSGCSLSLLVVPALLYLPLTPLNPAGLGPPLDNRHTATERKPISDGWSVSKLKALLKWTIGDWWLTWSPFFPGKPGACVNNPVKTNQHWRRHSFIKLKERSLITGLHYFIWWLTLLPGSPRAPSLPWEQTGSLDFTSLLGNAFHPIMRRTEMESRSYWPAASHVITPNGISLTFSPGGPLGPAKPWREMQRQMRGAQFVTFRPCSKISDKKKKAHGCR